MPIPPFLDRLLRAVGPSGHEREASAVWRDHCREFGAEVSFDSLGSSTARLAGTGGGPTLAVIGHIDEIGIHVTHIDDDGFLRFGQVGGWDAIVLVGQRIRLLTRIGVIIGVISRKPVHSLGDEERRRAPELKELHVDIGVRSGEEARRLVQIGDVGVIDADPLEIIDGRIVSRALDNRVGCYVAAEAARLVAESGGAPGDVVAMAVVQEETNLVGARTSAFGLDPDLAIVIDLTVSNDQPGSELGPVTSHALDSGPVVARGTMLHPAISELLIDVAEREEIEISVESLGKSTGTDADAVHPARAGIPTGLVSLPSRYMHTPVEMVSLSDIAAAAHLVAAFARRLEPGMSFAR